MFNKFPGERHRNLNVLIQSNEVMPKRAFGCDIYSCISSGSCWVWGIPPEGPEIGHIATVSESAGSEVLKSLTPVENSRLLRTQQTGTSSPSTTNPQITAWISELTQKRVPKLELSLKVFPERPPRFILIWLRGLKEPGEEGCRDGSCSLATFFCTQDYPWGHPQYICTERPSQGRITRAGYSL